MSALRRFGSFWWDFVVGDDWRLALSAACALAITAIAAALGATSWWITPLLITTALVAAVTAARRRLTLPTSERS
jgi:hypothetical protein